MLSQSPCVASSVSVFAAVLNLLVFRHRSVCECFVRAMARAGWEGMQHDAAREKQAATKQRVAFEQYQTLRGKRVERSGDTKLWTAEWGDDLSHTNGLPMWDRGSSMPYVWASLGAGFVKPPGKALVPGCGSG